MQENRTSPSERTPEVPDESNSLLLGVITAIISAAVVSGILLGMGLWA